MGGRPLALVRSGLADGEVGEEGVAAVGVELREDVVEQQDRSAAGDLGDHVVGGQPKGERQRPLLALGGVGAARAGRRVAASTSSRWGPTVDTPTPHVVLPGRRQRRLQAHGGPVRLVGGGDLRRAVGDGVVGLGQDGGQPVEQGLAGLGQAPADLDELGVPHVEREGGALVEPPAGPLEQGVPLLEDLVDLRAQGVVARVRRHQRVVQVAATLGRTALHQLEVVGREHRHPQHARAAPWPA